MVAGDVMGHRLSRTKYASQRTETCSVMGREHHSLNRTSSQCTSVTYRTHRACSPERPCASCAFLPSSLSSLLVPFQRTNFCVAVICWKLMCRATKLVEKIHRLWRHFRRISAFLPLVTYMPMLKMTLVSQESRLIE
jgi:hypothetical protein